MHTSIIAGYSLRDCALLIIRYVIIFSQSLFHFCFSLFFVFFVLFFIVLFFLYSFIFPPPPGQGVYIGEKEERSTLSLSSYVEGVKWLAAIVQLPAGLVPSVFSSQW
jgi:hypothetical protein